MELKPRYCADMGPLVDFTPQDLAAFAELVAIDIAGE